MIPKDNFGYAYQSLLAKINEKQSMNVKSIIPTGIQEDIIHAVAGVGIHTPNPRVVEVITANKVGKTTMLIGGVLKNIFWKEVPDSNGHTWFDYPLFKKWPFPKDGRIIGTPKNVQDDGPIRMEIKKWWPGSRYKAYYKGKHYLSYYEVEGDDGIYTFDVMTFDQSVSEFEGPVKGWTLVDEPPPPDLLGPIFSRFFVGGILFLGMTPISAGIVLDNLEDMERKGAKINRVSASIYENSVETGKPNSRGTMRGLMTNEQIEDYIATIPEDEKDVRLYGKVSSKSGKIFKDFDMTAHVRDFDLLSPYMKRANHYMVMDPHPKYYPFIQWWAVTEDEKYICYNEWPTHDTMKAYYDEVRLVKPCNLTIEQLSKIIKIQDYSQFGYNILKRWIDPRFVSAYTKASDDKSVNTKVARTTGFIEEFSNHGVDFTMPPFENISTQRDKIRELLTFDRMRPINQFNEPKIFWHTQCRNSIRAMDRHSWAEKDEVESELHKDPIDNTRMFLAGLGKKGYIEQSQKLKVEKYNNKTDEREVQERIKNYPDVSLA